MGQYNGHMLKKKATIFGPKMNQSMDSQKIKLDGFLTKGITAATKK